MMHCMTTDSEGACRDNIGIPGLRCKEERIGDEYGVCRGWHGDSCYRVLIPHGRAACAIHTCRVELVELTKK